MDAPRRINPHTPRFGGILGIHRFDEQATPQKRKVTIIMVHRIRFSLLITLLALLVMAGIAGAQGNGPRAYLGINLESREEGAFVVDVLPGTGADNAGLERGDLITHWDGQPINLETTLGDYISQNAPGDTVALTVKRDGETLELTATLGTHPDDIAAPDPVELPAGIVRGLRMTLDFTDMLYSDDLITVFDVPEYSAVAGTLEAGDRITAIDGQTVLDLGVPGITRRLLRGGLTTLDIVRDEMALRILLDAPPDRFSLMERTVLDVDALLEGHNP